MASSSSEEMLPAEAERLWPRRRGEMWRLAGTAALAALAVCCIAVWSTAVPQRGVVGGGRESELLSAWHKVEAPLPLTVSEAKRDRTKAALEEDEKKLSSKLFAALDTEAKAGVRGGSKATSLARLEAKAKRLSAALGVADTTREAGREQMLSGSTGFTTRIPLPAGAGGQAAAGGAPSVMLHVDGSKSKEPINVNIYMPGAKNAAQDASALRADGQRRSVESQLRSQLKRRETQLRAQNSQIEKLLSGGAPATLSALPAQARLGAARGHIQSLADSSTAVKKAGGDTVDGVSNAAIEDEIRSTVMKMSHSLGVQPPPYEEEERKAVGKKKKTAESKEEDKEKKEAAEEKEEDKEEHDARVEARREAKKEEAREEAREEEEEKERRAVRREEERREERREREEAREEQKEKDEKRREAKAKEGVVEAKERLAAKAAKLKAKQEEVRKEAKEEEERRQLWEEKKAAWEKREEVLEEEKKSRGDAAGTKGALSAPKSQSLSSSGGSSGGSKANPAGALASLARLAGAIHHDARDAGGLAFVASDDVPTADEEEVAPPRGGGGGGAFDFEGAAKEEEARDGIASPRPVASRAARAAPHHAAAAAHRSGGGGGGTGALEKVEEAAEKRYKREVAAKKAAEDKREGQLKALEARSAVPKLARDMSKDWKADREANHREVARKGDAKQQLKAPALATKEERMLRSMDSAAAGALRTPITGSLADFLGKKEAREMTKDNVVNVMDGQRRAEAARDGRSGSGSDIFAAERPGAALESDRSMLRGLESAAGVRDRAAGGGGAHKASWGSHRETAAESMAKEEEALSEEDGALEKGIGGHMRKAQKLKAEQRRVDSPNAWLKA